ncbi:MAG: hypothetical protein R3200_16320 [Xanthomonadales bacterium]|nr:hypothetical protein [Xanthomonadales bacterium]
MKKTLRLVIGLWSLACVARAEPIDALIGTWVSPDGSARQSYQRELDGTWIRVESRFKVDGEWQLVGVGGLYRKPGEEAWLGVSRTTDMSGFELFETRLTPTEAGGYDVRNLATQADGTQVETFEEWRFKGPDRIEYTIHMIAEGESKPFMTGVWVRATD